MTKWKIAIPLLALSEAVQACRRVASGKSGKVVLIMSGTDVLQETNALQSEALEM